MQYSVKDLKGYAIGATDGDIGKLDDFYFDDESWTIRYLVAETGSCLLNLSAYQQSSTNTMKTNSAFLRNGIPRKTL